MTGEELKDLLKTIQRTKCETQTLELKPLFEDESVAAIIQKGS